MYHTTVRPDFKKADKSKWLNNNDFVVRKVGGSPVQNTAWRTVDSPKPGEDQYLWSKADVNKMLTVDRQNLQEPQFSSTIQKDGLYKKFQSNSLTAKISLEAQMRKAKILKPAYEETQNDTIGFSIPNEMNSLAIGSPHSQDYGLASINKSPKGLTIEDLDSVFNKPTSPMAAHLE